MVQMQTQLHRFKLFMFLWHKVLLIPLNNKLVYKEQDLKDILKR